MVERWGNPEENMEDVHLEDFKVRKPKGEELDPSELGGLLQKHGELTRATDQEPPVLSPESQA